VIGQGDWIGTPTVSGVMQTRPEWDFSPRSSPTTSGTAGSVRTDPPEPTTGQARSTAKNAVVAFSDILNSFMIHTRWPPHRQWLGGGHLSDHRDRLFQTHLRTRAASWRPVIVVLVRPANFVPVDRCEAVFGHPIPPGRTGSGLFNSGDTPPADSDSFTKTLPIPESCPGVRP
jgi:hypothetical protein